MPIYEYLCDAPGGCGSRFDGYARMEDCAKPKLCDCGQLARKIISPTKGFGDFEPYESPASGRIIEGRRQRLEDFKRTGTRPYEDGEREAWKKRRDDEEKRQDAVVEAAVERTLNEITL